MVNLRHNGERAEAARGELRRMRAAVARMFTERSSIRRGEETASTQTERVQTTPTQCPYCGVGCGLLADVEDGRLVGVRGDKIHPANRGRTCRKPLGLPFAVYAPDRATVPLWRADRDARFEPAGWDDVLGTLAGRLQAIVEEH